MQFLNDCTFDFKRALKAKLMWVERCPEIDTFIHHHQGINIFLLVVNQTSVGCLTKPKRVENDLIPYIKMLKPPDE